MSHQRGFSGSETLTARETRRLLAVLAADVVGYTRLMQVEEDATHRRMRQLRSEVIDPRIAQHRGRVVKNTGDGFLATFENAHDATHCAIEMQREMIGRNANEQLARQINFRMG